MLHSHENPDPLTPNRMPISRRASPAPPLAGSHRIGHSWAHFRPARTGAVPNKCQLALKKLW